MSHTEDIACTEASHDHLRSDDAAWSSLRFRWHWDIGGVIWECRDCPRCGSTLMRDDAKEDVGREVSREPRL